MSHVLAPKRLAAGVTYPILSYPMWDRVLAADAGILKCAFLSDMGLALSLPPAKTHLTWSGAFLRALRWLAADGGPCAGQVRCYLNGINNTIALGTGALAGMRVPLGARVLQAWDEAFRAHTAAAAAAHPAGVRAQYLATFAVTDAEREVESGFPSDMPYYFRHTSHFHNTLHASALMRVRCCSPPFAASPTLHTGAPTQCHVCTLRADETSEHALLDCPAYADLRSDAQFAPLFAAPLPAQARLRTFIHQPQQHILAQFVHTCFERRAELLDVES